MKTLKTKWTGIRPLVMSNPRTVKVSDPFAIEARRLNAAMKAARKKGDENKMLELEPQIIRNDWEASSYWDEAESKFFVPDTLLLASIRGGAAAAKKGKDIERAVIITETQAFIETESTKSLDLAFKNMAFRLECPCKIPPKTGSLVWKCRCMVPTGWTLEFSIEFDDEIIAQKSLVEALTTAGRVVGIGGWRPKFGRFLVEIF